MRIYKFDGLCGNANTISLIKRSLVNKTFNRFTIFGGVLGTGKSTCAGIASMALTCSNPMNGEPCMKCEVCRMNIEALEEVGESPFVKVVNLGKKNKFEDIEELIKDVFVFQSGSSKQVYVFEEAHAIKNIKGGFTAFLAEIDRMPKNVYVIMCTTSLHDIQADLKSRAMIFNFNRLSQKDSLLLCQRTVRRLGGRIPDSIIDLVVKNGKGIPRDLEKLLQFVHENSVSEEEMREYLQEISYSTFINIFRAMKDSDFATAVNQYKDVLEEFSSERVITCLKDFLADVVFYVDGGIKGNLTSLERMEIDEIFTSQKVGKIISIVEGMNRETTESDLSMAYIKMFSAMQGTSVSSMITENKSHAAKERVVANRQTQEMASFGGHQKGLTSLSAKSLSRLS